MKKILRCTIRKTPDEWLTYNPDSSGEWHGWSVYDPDKDKILASGHALCNLSDIYVYVESSTFKKMYDNMFTNGWQINYKIHLDEDENIKNKKDLVCKYYYNKDTSGYDFFILDGKDVIYAGGMWCVEGPKVEGRIMSSKVCSEFDAMFAGAWNMEFKHKYWKKPKKRYLKELAVLKELGRYHTV